MARGPQIASYGIAVAPGRGWDAAIYRRQPVGVEESFPVMHAATIPLPADRADYGGGLVELLGVDDVFVAALEFGPEAAAQPLFAAEGIPTLTPASFRPKQLQRVINGQAGAQRFFHVGGRAFCLYAVIGSYASRVRLSRKANDLVATLQIAGDG